MIIPEFDENEPFPEMMMFTEASIRHSQSVENGKIYAYSSSVSKQALCSSSCSFPPQPVHLMDRHVQYGLQEQAGAGVCDEETSMSSRVSSDPLSMENKGRSCGPQFSAEVSPLS